MVVAVTGGTGFVGAHAVAALARAGHAVRLLVRDESAAHASLAPLGVSPGEVDVVVGDVLDEASVRAAVRGSTAVLHAASVYSFDSRRRAELRRTNERGTEVVLGAARRAGAGRVVHVSSIAALFGRGVRAVTAESPVGTSREPYLASKAAADRIARAHRAAGVPVVVTYPPALLGPHDPRLGDQATRVRDVLRGLTPIWPRGGLGLGDVRDTAALHAHLLTAPDPVPARVLGPGRHVTTAAYLDALRTATGRRLPALRLPARALLPVGVLADAVQRIWPWHVPVQYGAILTCAYDTRLDEAAAAGARPLLDTVTDTVRWLHGRGLLTDRQAGDAAARRETTAPRGGLDA